MQLDFFARLIAAVRPTPVSPDVPARAEVSPVPPPAAVPEARPKLFRIPSTEELLQQARGYLRSAGTSDALLPALAIRWNPRMRSTAGMAYPGKCLITLNPRLAQFGLEEIDRTLRHELAHLLAQARVGRRRIPPHGREWQQACVDLGFVQEPRCHNLPLPRRHQARNHVYHCPGCGFELRRTRPLRRRSACLACCRKHNGGRYDARFRFKPLAT